MTTTKAVVQLLAVFSIVLILMQLLASTYYLKRNDFVAICDNGGAYKRCLTSFNQPVRYTSLRVNTVKQSEAVTL